jgi:protein involved in polysaccharide export with SLBB domain
MRLPIFAALRGMRKRMRLGVVGVTLAAIAPAVGIAQSSSGGGSIGIDKIEQILQGRFSSQGNGITGNQPEQNEIILQPSAPSAPLPTSRLEEIMSQRAGVKLRQFGYDQFGVGRAVAIPQTGAVQNDYILGPGDEIDVTLRGQNNAEYEATVDRNGQVVLPLLNPISAAGRTFGEFRQDLLNQVRRAYVSTQAFVAVSRLRQISVLVTGEVANPGAQILTGLSTAADAIVVSGGIKKTGSLRAVQVVRNGRVIHVDLYALISQRGIASNVHLTDGDRVIVPSLGRTVAATGWVRLPGIYELSPGTSAITVASLASLAGGFEVQGKYRLSVLRLDSDGSSHMVPVDRRDRIKDGEILYAQRAAEQVTNQGELAGGTALAGRFPITMETRLSDVIREPGAIGTSPDTTFGIISRRDQTSYIRSLIAFTPAAVLKGTEDLQLQTGDVVRVFSASEAQMLRHAMMQFHQFRTYVQEAQRDPQGLLPSPALNSDQVSADEDFLQQLGHVQEALNTNPPLNNPYGNAAQPQIPTPNNTFPLYTGASAMNGTAAIGPYPGAGGMYPNTQPNPYGPNAQQPYGYPGTTNPGNAMSQNPGTPNQGNPYQGNPYSNQTYPGTTPPNGANPQQTSPNRPNFYPNVAGISSLAQQAFPGSQFGQPLSQPPQQTNVPAGVLSGVPPANLQEQNLYGTQVPTNEEAVSFIQVAQQLSIEPLILANFLMDHVVILSGAVRGPGVYFGSPALTLDVLIAAAGGASNWADESGIDIVSTNVDRATGVAATHRQTVKMAFADTYRVKSRDQVRIHEVYANAGIGSVTLQGEFRYAGTYQITRGEHLSQLLSQAGGLTDFAYPYGTIYLRRSAASLEAQGYQRAADEIQSQLIGAMTRVTSSATNRLSPNDFTSLQTFVNQLRLQKPLGRISVVADPSLLATKPSLDPLLEPGDVIYMPQRPSTVTVLGQVSQPGSFPFQEHADAADYVEDAGGYAQYADSSTAFIVLPNGKAEKLNDSWFNLERRTIPPGSTIVVPRDLEPYDNRQLILDITQIMSQLAIAAASLAVLSNQ